MASIEVRGIHCVLESTWGKLSGRRAARRRRESDEIAFIIAVLPIDTFGEANWTNWTYADRRRFFEVRAVNDVDSGEAHAFSTPIRIDLETRPDSLYEIVTIMYEVDGGTGTSSQADQMLGQVRQHLNRDARPGLGLGSLPTPTGESAPPSYGAHFRYAGAGGNDDMLLTDIWHLDPSDPMAPFDVPSVADMRPGRQDPDIIVDQQQSDRRIDVDVSRFPSRPDRVIERRQYTNHRERAIYHFDVHYLR